MGRLPKFQCGHPRYIRSNLTVTFGHRKCIHTFITWWTRWVLHMVDRWIWRPFPPRGICCWPLEASVVSKRPEEVEVLDIWPHGPENLENGDILIRYISNLNDYDRSRSCGQTWRSLLIKAVATALLRTQHPCSLDMWMCALARSPAPFAAGHDKRDGDLRLAVLSKNGNQNRLSVCLLIKPFIINLELWIIWTYL